MQSLESFVRMSRQGRPFASKLALAFLVGTFLTPAQAFAQAADGPAAGTPSDAGTIDDPQFGEIIVTARKQSEVLSRVGLSITAASGEELASRGITAVTELVKLEPSLQFAKSFDSTPIFTIRGVGYNDNSIQAPPTVSVYMDEVPYAYPVMTKGAMLDVQRVEILKGPQGTLFGQNATGGAINFIANKPTDYLTAGATFTYGNFNAAHLDGFVSGPLTDTLSARLAIGADRGGAWQLSNTRDDKLGDKDNFQSRLLLDWKPTSRFSAILNLNMWLDRSEAQAPQLYGIYVKSPQFVGLGARNFMPTAAQIAAMPAYASELREILSQPLSAKNNRAADWVAGTHPRADQRFKQAALRMTWDFNDKLTLTSLTSYENYKQRDENDTAGVAVRANTRLNVGKINSFFQELRANGTFSDNEANWQIGANYIFDKSNQFVDQYTTQSGSYLSGFPPSVGVNPPFHRLLSYANNTTETKSVFGSISVPVFRTLKINASARYTDVHSDFGGCVGTPDPQLVALVSGVFGDGSARVGDQCITVLSRGGPSGYYRTTLREDNVAWRIGLEWQATDKTLIYALASRGYKAAAAPILTATTFAQLRPVTQESVIDYEAGLKTRLFDDSVRLNASIFYYDYTDKQLLARFIDPIFGPLQGLTNIPKSREFGVEGSIVWTPLKGITLDGAVTYLDSKVTSDFPNTDVYGNEVNFKGESYPFTPTWAASGGIRYDWQANAKFNAFVAARGSYQSSTVTSFGEATVIATQSPSIAIKPYGLLDLSAGFGPADQRWRFELWARNVTNTYYWTNANSGGDLTLRITGAPRTYGFTLKYEFK